jgi:hypothetical protein
VFDGLATINFKHDIIISVESISWKHRTQYSVYHSEQNCTLKAFHQQHSGNLPLVCSVLGVYIVRSFCGAHGLCTLIRNLCGNHQAGKWPIEWGATKQLFFSSGVEFHIGGGMFFATVWNLDSPWGFKEFEASRLHDNRHTKVVRLSALRTGCHYSQEMPLEVLLVSGTILEPQCNRKH